MSFWGRLFGTEKALNSVVSAARDGIDALVYTDEERADDAAKDRSEARSMVVQWMQATSGQNLARRLIALVITSVWLIMHLLSIAISMVAVVTNNGGAVTAEKLKEVSDIARDGALEMNPAVMLIIAFYFAAPHMGDIAKAVTGKFTRTVRSG